jgi:hypothetical protein
MVGVTLVTHSLHSPGEANMHGSYGFSTMCGYHSGLKVCTSIWLHFILMLIQHPHGLYQQSIKYIHTTYLQRLRGRGGV